jgi:hypothetical protein
MTAAEIVLEKCNIGVTWTNAYLNVSAGKRVRHGQSKGLAPFYSQILLGCLLLTGLQLRW